MSVVTRTIPTIATSCLIYLQKLTSRKDRIKSRLSAYDLIQGTFTMDESFKIANNSKDYPATDKSYGVPAIWRGQTRCEMCETEIFLGSGILKYFDILTIFRTSNKWVLDQIRYS